MDKEKVMPNITLSTKTVHMTEDDDPYSIDDEMIPVNQDHRVNVTGDGAGRGILIFESIVDRVTSMPKLGSPILVHTEQLDEFIAVLEATRKRLGI